MHDALLPHHARPYYPAWQYLVARQANFDRAQKRQAFLDKQKQDFQDELSGAKKPQGAA